MAYKDPTHIQLIDKEKKGYVYLENEELKSSIYLKGNIYTPHYKLLLPEEFRHNAILGTTYQNKLMLISKGQLFIFKKTIKPKADTLSIRTISPHFLEPTVVFFKMGNDSPIQNIRMGISANSQGKHSFAMMDCCA